MDQTILVTPDIAAGRGLLKAVDTSGLQIEAAFWWLEDDEWRLVLATPLVHQIGPLATYSRIWQAIEANAELPRELFDKIQVVTPSAGVMTALDIGSEGRLPLNRFVQQEHVNSVYVAGAYFYRFEPKTFARAQ